MTVVTAPDNSGADNAAASNGRSRGADRPAPRLRPLRARFRRFVRGAAVVLALCVLSVVGAGVAVTLFGARTYHWRAFDIEAGIRPSLRGETRLIFAPLGEVRARTHATPVALTVSLRAIQFDAAQRLITQPPPRRELERDFQRTARTDLRDMAFRQIALGAVGALCVPLLLRLWRGRYWLLCAAAGGLFVAGVFGSMLRTFNGRAFENPTYTGSLRQAEWIISLAKDGFNQAETLSDKLKRVADNLDTLYTRIDTLPASADRVDTVRILHISDIHNNPAAAGFVQELAARTRVDAVIDTGDLTDFGTPLEAHLSRIAGSLRVPYLFVAGNHDSRSTVAAVAANRNAVILAGVPIHVAGLTVLGSPDPSSMRPTAGSVDTPLPALQAAGAELATAYRAAEGAGDRPDIVCVHDPAQAQPLIGTAPLVLCGHEHHYYVQQIGTTVVCNAGTTGAAGARYFDHKQGVPFSAAILAFSRHDPIRPRLLYIDMVVLDGTLGQYSVIRRTFAGPQPAAAHGGNGTLNDVEWKQDSTRAGGWHGRRNSTAAAANRRGDSRV